MTWFLRLFLLALLALPAAAQTQLDPNFLAQQLYQPTTFLRQALQLADGSRVFVGSVGRADGTTINHSLVKYLPSGQLDAVFNAQVAQYQFAAATVAEAPGNKLVVGLSDPGTFGAQTRYDLVRLLANGTLDTSFAPQPPSFSLSYGIMYLVQTDGKIVVGNDPARAVSQSARTLARLNADGTPDTSFGTSLPASFTDLSRSLYDPIKAICQQPDGKLLVAHAATGSSGPGSFVYRLVRLLPSGALDTGFAYSGPLSAQMALALQPDGKLLVATPGVASSGLLTRILPSGAVDFTFQAPTNLVADRTDERNNPAVIQVQPDGRILVAGVAERAATQAYGASSFVVRLLATGARDASWQPPMYGDYQAYASGIQLLPNGQLLVAGAAKLYASATALPSAVGLLDPNGANVAGFAPVLEQGGQVLSIALQADGRIVAGGEFTEINGTPARNLARFNADGTLDAAFTANAAVMGGYVREIQLQTDGKIVLGGQFISAGGQARFAVARLLPSGLCDPAFAPTLSPNSVFNVQEANYVAIQPDGQVLASGSLLPVGALQPRPLVRFAAAGVLDASFQPAGVTNGNYIYPLLVQPDGKILTAGLDYSGGTIGPVTYESVTRLLPNGSLDPSFVRVPTGRNGTDSPAQIWQLERYPDGRLLAGGRFLNYGSTAANNLIRLLATGAVDATFTSPITSFVVQTTAIQPNGRVLAGGVNYSGGNPPIIRLLSDGSFDAGFIRTQGPALGSWVRKLLVQPNGGILVAGNFYTVAGQTRQGLVRLLDANVLRVASQQTETATTAWPVPTHGDLHLALDATARPQQVQLLDALGRVVLTQAVSQPALTLATTALPAGTYLLRVRYAASTVTRRVVVE